MVTYLPSSASRTILVLTAEVGTMLTIDAPAEVIQGVPLYIYGLLTRSDTGSAIIGAIISITYNGTLLGSATTTEDGIYEMTTTIPATGTFTLTASFAGRTVPGLTLGASSATARVGLAEPNMLPLLAVLGIVAYAVLKK